MREWGNRNRGAALVPWSYQPTPFRKSFSNKHTTIKTQNDQKKYTQHSQPQQHKIRRLSTINWWQADLPHLLKLWGVTPAPWTGRGRWRSMGALAHGWLISQVSAGRGRRRQLQQNTLTCHVSHSGASKHPLSHSHTSTPTNTRAVRRDGFKITDRNNDYGHCGGMVEQQQRSH